MVAVARPSLRPVGIVVGISGQGLDAYRTAVRLGAEEATLRRVPLRFVHGSRPDGLAAATSAAGMESRQQRGRRLVNGAARGLAGTVLGRKLQISTDSSPQTGTDLLLGYGRSAVMLVLQHGDDRDLTAGPTTRAVTAAADCPTLVARTDDAEGRVPRTTHGLPPPPPPAAAPPAVRAPRRWTGWRPAGRATRPGRSGFPDRVAPPVRGVHRRQNMPTDAPPGPAGASSATHDRPTESLPRQFGR